MVLVEAPWCHNCRALAPLLAEVAAAHPEVALVRVDASRDPFAAEALGVRGTPTLIGRVSGEERFRTSGVRTRAELDAMFAALTSGTAAPRAPRSDAVLRIGAGSVLAAAGALAGAVPLLGVGLTLVGWGAATIMSRR